MATAGLGARRAGRSAPSEVQPAKSCATTRSDAQGNDAIGRLRQLAKQSMFVGKATDVATLGLVSKNSILQTFIDDVAQKWKENNGDYAHVKVAFV